MLETITKKQIEKAAKEFANQNIDKDWQEAVNIFNWMQDFLNKENNKSSIKFNPNKYTIINNGVKLVLRKRMFDLAYFLYENYGRYISREEILNNVWGDVVVDDRSIDVHVRLLRDVIPNIPIKTKIGIGYGWIEE